MDTPNRSRTPFRNINNDNRAPETDVQKRKREERNRKQREYRARKKAEANNPNLVPAGSSEPSTGSTNSSTVISGTPLTPATSSLSQQRKRERDSEQRSEMSEEQREQRTRKQHEYRARKKAEGYNVNRGNAGSSKMDTPTIDTEDSINKLIADVFPSLEENATSVSYMRTRAILSANNDHVDQLNAKMIEKFPGQEKVYYSFDSVDDSHNYYLIDFLNSITPNGLPPHVLRVKVNCPVILLQNLDPNNGFCNGTRLMVRALQNHSIVAEIVDGQHAGKRMFIPRIPMSPSDYISLPCKFKRKQLPIRLSFAMTINEAQGQIIPNARIYPPKTVSSHGQLYVALSRGVSRQTTGILTQPQKDLDSTGKSTKNIVYQDILDR
ncbi:hypothetical protein ACP70R_004301 [Stipagrostis hirtigluma subsp. patula]